MTGSFALLSRDEAHPAKCLPSAQRCAFTATLRRGDEFELMKELGCRGEFLTFRAALPEKHPACSCSAM
jgi:hypothetical protein